LEGFAAVTRGPFRQATKGGGTGRGTYGPRRIQNRKFKATINSAHLLPVAENLPNQQFDVSDPGTVYGTDITDISTDEGWLYLAGVDVVALGMRPSMSRKGNCSDNAAVESFWGTLKEELVYHRRFRTRFQAYAAIQEYIEVFYNRMRRHSALGNFAPAVFAQNHLSKRRSA
jgi:putative transposase